MKTKAVIALADFVSGGKRRKIGDRFETTDVDAAHLASRSLAEIAADNSATKKDAEPEESPKPSPAPARKKTRRLKK